LPDGRVQTVNYKADSNGYQADILYNEHQKKKQPPPKSPAPSPHQRLDKVPPKQYSTKHETKQPTDDRNNGANNTPAPENQISQPELSQKTEIVVQNDQQQNEQPVNQQHSWI